MTYTTLAWANAWRKPARTVLLIFSVSVAFVIYGLVSGFYFGAHGSSDSADDRLIVTNRASAGQKLPLAYLHRIESLEGIGAVGYTARLRAFDTVESNVVPISAVDPERAYTLFGSELGLTRDLIDALDGARDNVLIGRALAAARNWSVGETIAVTAIEDAQKNGNLDWRFHVAGIFEGGSQTADTYFMVARYDYVNPLRRRNSDTVDTYVIAPKEGINSSVLAPKVDAMFRNSTAETRSQAERQFLHAFIRQFADIRSIILLVVGASFVTIIMIVTNTMLFAIRERTFEIGVLKTLGVPSWRILSLVLSETVFIFVLGGLLGILFAFGLYSVADPAIGLVFTSFIAASSLIVAMGLALVCGFAPSINAMRTRIVTALQKR